MPAAIGHDSATSAARAAAVGRTPPGLQLAWLVMALLAVAVAGYATALLLAPPVRNGFVRGLLASSPLLAPLHFGGGAIALLAGALQAHRGLRLRRPDVHRWTGRLYLVAVLASGSAGLLLALRSTAGPVAQWGFGAMAVLWLVTTTVGWRHARAGRYPAHRDWMIRSYALTLAAVTLRLWLPLSQVAGIAFMTAYVAVAWLCWVPNLVLAEWFLRRRPRPSRFASPLRGSAA